MDDTLENIAVNLINLLSCIQGYLKVKTDLLLRLNHSGNNLNTYMNV